MDTDGRRSPTRSVHIRAHPYYCPTEPSQRAVISSVSPVVRTMKQSSPQTSNSRSFASIRGFLAPKQHQVALGVPGAFAAWRETSCPHRAHPVHPCSSSCPSCSLCRCGFFFVAFVPFRGHSLLARFGCGYAAPSSSVADILVTQGETL